MKNHLLVFLIFFIIFSIDIISQTESKAASPRNEFTADEIYSALKSEKNIERKLYLFDQLKEVEDEKKRDFINENYSTLENDELKLKALEVLTNEKDEKSILIFKKLILSDTPRTEVLSFLLFDPFFDSVALMQIIFPDILQLIKYDEYRSRILYLMGYGIDSIVLKPEHYLSYENELVEKCKELSQKMDDSPEDEKEEYIWDIHNIIKTFGVFVNNKDAVNILRKYSDHENNYISSSSVLGLLQLNEQIDNGKLIKYAENINFRNIFYNDLKRITKIEYFPSEFLTQKLFAESDLYNFLYYDYSEPDSLVLIDSLTNEEGTFYLYKFLLTGEGYDEEYEEQDESNTAEDWFVGISGPQPLNKNEVITNGNKTGTFYSLLTDKSIEEHWKELLTTE